MDYTVFSTYGQALLWVLCVCDRNLYLKPDRASLAQLNVPPNIVQYSLCDIQADPGAVTGLRPMLE